MRNVWARREQGVVGVAGQGIEQRVGVLEEAIQGRESPRRRFSQVLQAELGQLREKLAELRRDRRYLGQLCRCPRQSHRRFRLEVEVHADLTCHEALHLQLRPQAGANQPLEVLGILGQSLAPFPSDLLRLEFQDNRDAGAHGLCRKFEGDVLDLADAHAVERDGCADLEAGNRIR